MIKIIICQHGQVWKYIKDISEACLFLGMFSQAKFVVRYCMVIDKANNCHVDLFQHFKKRLFGNWNDPEIGNECRLHLLVCQM